MGKLVTCIVAYLFHFFYKLINSHNNKQIKY